MRRVDELVAEYASLLQPCYDMASAVSAADHYGKTIKTFRAAVRELGDVETEIVEGLRGLLVDRDWRQIDLWLNAADERASAGLVEPLCDLLAVRDRYIQHEWIAEMLGEIGSARAVRALKDACSFDVGGDTSRSLPRCCLDALMAIGTAEAMMAVRSQLSSPWPEVSEYAEELLTEEK
jgi:HEAT repeat protein